MTPVPRLYAIADAGFGDPVEFARALFEGGARLVQLRNKSANARELLKQVEDILGIAPSDARVIVNDRADIAKISGAAGVHLGQTDLPPHMEISRLQRCIVSLTSAPRRACCQSLPNQVLATFSFPRWRT